MCHVSQYPSKSGFETLSTVHPLLPKNITLVYTELNEKDNFEFIDI